MVKQPERNSYHFTSHCVRELCSKLGGVEGFAIKDIGPLRELLRFAHGFATRPVRHADDAITTLKSVESELMLLLVMSGGFYTLVAFNLNPIGWTLHGPRGLVTAKAERCKSSLYNCRAGRVLIVRIDSAKSRGATVISATA